MRTRYIISVIDKRKNDGRSTRSFDDEKALFNYMIKKKLKVKRVTTLYNGEAHQYLAYVDKKELKKIC